MAKKAKVGRPTKYKPEYCEKVIEHMRLGKSLTSFAASIGSYRELLYDWQKANPEFLHACKTAQELSQEWWEEFAMQAATGRIYDETHKGKYDKHNPNMIQFMMSRRFKDFYQKRNVDENSDENKKISINLAYKPDDL